MSFGSLACHEHALLGISRCHSNAPLPLRSNRRQQTRRHGDTFAPVAAHMQQSRPAHNLLPHATAGPAADSMSEGVSQDQITAPPAQDSAGSVLITVSKYRRFQQH